MRVAINVNPSQAKLQSANIGNVANNREVVQSCSKVNDVERVGDRPRVP
jgi:hypothetical protein